MLASPDCLITPMPIDAAEDGAARLSARLVKGEEEAWTEFHQRTFDRLLRYLLRAAHGSEDAAREALQATYVKCVRHVRCFATEEAMWGWLAQIARGCLIDLARKQRRYAELLERFTDEPTTAAFEGSDSLVSESQLAEGLSRLQPEDRTLLEARYTAEEPIAKIAATLGTTPKAVESRLARIRQRLRIWLTRTDHDEA